MLCWCLLDSWCKMKLVFRNPAISHGLHTYSDNPCVKLVVKDPANTSTGKPLYGIMLYPLISSTWSLKSCILSISLSTSSLISFAKWSGWKLFNLLLTPALRVEYQCWNGSGCFCERSGIYDLSLGCHGCSMSGAACLVYSHKNDCENSWSCLLYSSLVGGLCATLVNMARAAVALAPILAALAPAAAWVASTCAADGFGGGANDINIAV